MEEQMPNEILMISSICDIKRRHSDASQRITPKLEKVNGKILYFTWIFIFFIINTYIIIFASYTLPNTYFHICMSNISILTWQKRFRGFYVEYRPQS